VNVIDSSNLESVGRKRVAGSPKRVRKNIGKRKTQRSSRGKRIALKKS